VKAARGRAYTSGPSSGAADGAVDAVSAAGSRSSDNAPPHTVVDDVDPPSHPAAGGVADAMDDDTPSTPVSGDAGRDVAASGVGSAAGGGVSSSLTDAPKDMLQQLAALRQQRLNEMGVSFQGRQARVEVPKVRRRARCRRTLLCITLAPHVCACASSTSRQLWRRAGRRPLHLQLTSRTPSARDQRRSGRWCSLMTSSTSAATAATRRSTTRRWSRRRTLEGGLPPPVVTSSVSCPSQTQCSSPP
jgi:hypothetical protein